MTGTFVSKRGCCGGGGTRTTTPRAVAAAGGRAAVVVRLVIRIESRVGTTGTGPRRTGVASTVRITARSWTKSRETFRPETKTVWLTTVT